MTQCIESDGNELYIGDDPYWRGRALKAEAEVERLRIRIRELVAALDVHYGTPCEQIRHQDEVERAIAEEPTP